MIRIYLHSIHCHEETDEVGADEPYVLVTSVNLASMVNVAGFAVPLPGSQVVRYGPFDDVDEGETHYAPGISQSFWGINGAPAQLSDPETTIFIVSLIENDNGNAGNLRGIVAGSVSGALFSSLSLNRADKVTALLREINSASQTVTGFPNTDDLVGAPQELRFSTEELALAERGVLVSRTLSFHGDGGHYSLTFHALNDFGVFGVIGEKWAQTGRAAGPLGIPTSGEIPTYDGIGRFRNFAGGIVSWHPETGAHIVWGLIGERWLQIGREQFGYPITDESPTADGRGRYNHFRAIQLPGKPEASIHWSPASGAHETYGAIRDKWASMGWETSHLGYPVDAERDHAGGRLQRFQGGSLFWTPHGGVVVQ
ncbi:LGFP repeat-containing protein [Massilia pseudoviolaceinigra]|uniref:LGFP repeat-containing protein n=1 Tax=Massilia pseudoviolaceinigra TaxID=3057165 RepID=UPI002796AC32|nr:hypothetical protein [Massilia sp. CCM 9206]MDQ1923562.1 hypothetical protein [Massilia sp. CCM 9206]